MIHKNSEGIVTISLFEHLPIRAAYSCRTFGDMRSAANRDEFLHRFGAEAKNLIMARQIHGVRVATVTRDDRGKTLPDVDGLVYKKSNTPAVLGVTFADCVPVIGVDPSANIIGTAHAGWKGTIEGIATELIISMVKNGAQLDNIYISIGPHIGMCCYNVPEKRVRLFRKRFGNNEKITHIIHGDWHMDIGYANYIQLLESGIVPTHIDAPVLCTSCQVASFNSFRKDTKKTFGVQLGVITI